MDATKKLARRAGLLYFLFSLFGPFALLYVPGKIFVKGDAAATADRIRSSETLLRIGIGTELVGFAGFIFVALALYRLFKPVSEGHALATMVLGIVSAPISFVCILGEIAALDFAGSGGGGQFLAAFNGPQRDALAYMSLRLHGQGFLVAGIFWGLWLFPFGICVIRSGFIPRILGILLIIAGSGYVASTFVYLVLPQYANAVGRITEITNIGELPIIFWLLIWGARPQRATAQAA
ncbi:MAG TPA: DUF4386 domain-containing protein [Thermoanaerobaculia bacterium]